MERERDPVGGPIAASNRAADEAPEGHTLELAAPEVEGVGRDLMLAQLEASLFGSAEAQPFRVGRFTILEKLGAGGMGVVHAAFDPDLERKIAIKFVRDDVADAEGRARARLLREAQALARLDHPNVVSVYDVGAYEGGIYIAMEFVRGTSLRDWVEDGSPTTQQILDAYLQAGRGLAAAHEAGIVHRDFKPDNAILGDDGRVRVLDFGLAASELEAWSSEDDLTREAPADEAEGTGRFSQTLTRTGAVMGTPLYMAPEQHRGERADARSDQFAFCVSLWIAVYDRRPFAGQSLADLGEAVGAGRLQSPPSGTKGVPKRVRQALERGLAADPKDRFERLEDLLLELDTGGRRRRVGLWAGAGLSLAAIAGGIIAWQVKARAEPSVCETALADIDRIWNEARRMDATAHLGGAAVAGTWTKVAAELDAYTGKWRSAVQGLCAQEEFDFDRMSCLEWRRQEVETVAEILLELPADQLHLVAEAVGSLTPIESCTDARALRVLPPPHPDPETRKALQGIRLDLARARVLQKSGRHDEALRTAHAADDAARGHADAGTQAEAALLLGEIYVESGRLDEAEAYLEKAVDAAESGAHDIVRARALADLVGLVGFARGEPTARLEARFRALHDRIGELPSRAYADFSNSLTMTRLGHGQLEAAESAGREALAEAKRLGIDPTLAEAQLALTLTLLGRYDEAGKMLDAILERIDDQHPKAVMVFGIAGIQRGFAGEDARALQLFERALALESRRALRQPHYRAIVGTYLATSLDRLGEFERAVQTQEASIAALRKLWGEGHTSLGRAHHQFGTTLADNGRWGRARESFQRSIEIWSVTHGPDSRAVAQPETGLARVLLHEGRDAEALRILEAAMRKLDQGSGHPAEDARTWFHLARALQRTGGDPRRAQTLAQRALDALEALGPGYEHEREQIRTWLRDPAADPPDPQNAPPGDPSN